MANLLINENTIKIGDLGFAKRLANADDFTVTFLGTTYTMAPEVLEGKVYGIECDMYSLGVIFY